MMKEMMIMMMGWGFELTISQLLESCCSDPRDTRPEYIKTVKLFKLGAHFCNEIAALSLAKGLSCL